jgi:hypothetical protein
VIDPKPLIHDIVLKRFFTISRYESDIWKMEVTGEER